MLRDGGTDPSTGHAFPHLHAPWRSFLKRHDPSGKHLRSDTPELCRPRTVRCTSGLPQRSERGPHFLDEQGGLLPGGKVAAPVELVVVDEPGIGPLRPTTRRRIDFVWEDADGDWDFHAL